MADAAASSPPENGQGGQDIPEHVAIIMDGNGRWAKARGLPRSAGHERGVEALRATVEAAGQLGIRRLTVFSFSTENWRRPATEVSALFALLKAYVKRDLKRLAAEGVRVQIIGRRERVPDDVAELIDRAERETAHNSEFVLTIAFNYGGRQEIADAAQALAKDVETGRLQSEDISEETFARYLDTSGHPDPDLLIRTSGECRISNFLLWQLAYTELIFMDVLWPDFGRAQLEEALEHYRARERRYGAVTPGAA